MNTLKVLRSRHNLFFRLSGIRLEDFDLVVKKTHTPWLKNERKRLFLADCQRSIGAGRKYGLNFQSQLLMHLIYYRTYTTHVFLI